MSKLAVIAMVGAFGALVAAGLSCLLTQSARQMRLDPTPLPRPRIHAPYIPSPDNVVDVMLETAQIRKEDLVFDLGCGDGRLVIGAAKKFGCHGVGFDKDPQRIKEAQAKVVENGVEELVRIEEADVFTVDLSNADVVLMYLLPWMIQELIPQFADLKPGSRIVSHDFFIEGIQADDEIEIFVGTQQERHVAYLYVTPLKRDGGKERGREGARERGSD
ncbi:MAG: cyclopropane-fatty-acyl-phospholipid synthase family protein [Pirellulaceae bacterium]